MTILIHELTNLNHFASMELLYLQRKTLHSLGACSFESGHMLVEAQVSQEEEGQRQEVRMWWSLLVKIEGDGR